MTPSVRTQTWLPSLFTDFFDDEILGRRHHRPTTPAVNVLEDDKGYKIELAAPGMSKEDLKVSINEYNDIEISFEKKTENCDKKDGKTYLRQEFSYNSFRQSFTLPDDVDLEKIDAKMENGILNIELPKKEVVVETPATRSIEIK